MKYFTNKEISKKHSAEWVFNSSTHQTIMDISQIEVRYIIKKTASTEAALNQFRTDNKWFLQDKLEG